MTYKKRVDMLRVLVDSHPTVRSSPKLSQIVGEMNRITASTKVSKNNGWLLSVLHTTRTLDTTLSEILRYKGWQAQSPGLGKYLTVLRNNGVLWPSEKNDYSDKIVKKRNKYMHEAGAMPNQLEADGLLSEMHACLTLVLGRLLSSYLTVIDWRFSFVEQFFDLVSFLVLRPFDQCALRVTVALTATMVRSAPINAQIVRICAPMADAVTSHWAKHNGGTVRGHQELSAPLKSRLRGFRQAALAYVYAFSPPGTDFRICRGQGV